MEAFNGVKKAFGRLLKVAFIILVSFLVVSYFFAMPLGLELFLFENISTQYSPTSLFSVTIFWTPLHISFGLAFSFLFGVYLLCLVAAWRMRGGFHRAIRNAPSRPLGDTLKNFLFAMPVITSMTLVAVDAIHYLQESHGFPTGEPPISKDPMLALLQLTISPLIEEVVFRIIPIGAFLIIYLLMLGRRKEPLTRWRERLKVSLLALLYPEKAKRLLGLGTVDDSGFRAGISLDEWVMVLLTSVIFGLAHYGGTWEAGKITSTFVQGFAMGLSYLLYGVQAPILLHWFFNYYRYTFSLAAGIHPGIRPFYLLNETLIMTLGMLGWLAIAVLGARKVAVVGKSVETNLLRRGKEWSKALRWPPSIFLRFSSSEWALLTLTLAILALRLTIINVPGPEAGERYYDTGLVFDEFYYVKAARRLLVGEPWNNEHPPLSKALIMLGIILFGDRPLGWRFFTVISSSVSIVLLYELALDLTGNRAVSLSAAALFATDIMAFNIGQIAILDAPSIMFTLMAAILFLRKRYELSAVALGLAFLCKIASIFAAIGLLVFLLLKRPIRRGKALGILRDWMPVVGRTLLVGFAVGLAGLWIYDIGYNVFHGNPFEHLNLMFSYHTGLRYENPGDVILPLQWINPLQPFPPTPYYVTTVREHLGGGIVREYHPIAYYGIYSPLWWGIWMAAPVAALDAIKRARKGEEQGTGLFVLAWIGANFLPNVVFAYFMQRWVYPFYFYMTMPGLYIGVTHYLSRLRFHKIALLLLVSVQLLWFFIWFPVKPKNILDLLASLGLPT